MGIEELQEKIAVAVENSKEGAILYKQLADLQNKEQQFEEASASFEKGLQILSESGEEDAELKAGLHLGASLAFANSEGLAEAEDHVMKAAGIYRALEQPYGLAQALRRKGSILLNRGDTKQGMADLNEAFELAERGDHFEEQGKVKSILGDLELMSKNFQKAVSRYQESLPLFKQSESHELQAESYMKIGQILIMHHKLEKAMDVYELAVDEYLEAGLEHEAANVYKVMAKTLESNGKNEEARTYFGQAAEEFEAAGDPLQQADCIYQIGYLYESDKDAVNAGRFYAKALPIAQESGDEMLIDTITDAYEDLQDKIKKGKIKVSESSSVSRSEGSTEAQEHIEASPKQKPSSLFSRLKDIFGNK